MSKGKEITEIRWLQKINDKFKENRILAVCSEDLANYSERKDLNVFYCEQNFSNQVGK